MTTKNATAVTHADFRGRGEILVDVAAGGYAPAYTLYGSQHHCLFHHEHCDSEYSNKSCPALNPSAGAKWINRLIAFYKPFPFSKVLYALLGITQATFTYLLCAHLTILPRALTNLWQRYPSRYFRSASLEQLASRAHQEIYSTPLRLVKMLTIMPMSMRMFILVLTNLFGSVIVIANDLPSSSITSATHFVARYHRFTDAASALGMKRLDAILRSVLYAHFSESLTRLGEIPRFVRDNKYIDLENRALFLTCLTGSSWLAVRLDALGSVPVFVIGIFTAVGLAGTSPAEVGLILTYKSQLLCSLPLTTCTPSSELSIMPAGRGDLVPGEAAHESTPRITEWPAQGEIEFKNVTMTYRPGLPTVLHDISLQIKPSEKIGMVGRTGAWLTDLCSNIAIIPQEPIPFSGAFFNPVRCATKGFSAATVDEMQALANAPEDARSDDGEVEIDSGDEYN
ncbi:hypothetical protein B0H16DRAFT_1716193 [Mycena metata]|uniref:ABC transmembrane type-1 domain-containing protein n=1 Tax=Mycena metata TaxID=1033252 RepID=A0AAD7JQ47_9AGAR|nr:hypothetical protein B0H16DRAFT_1716193 [Mycena metata]